MVAGMTNSQILQHVELIEVLLASLGKCKRP